MNMCPYYQMDYKQCNFFGSNQNQEQRDRYCLTSDNWRHCVNYENRSLDERLSKKLRTNPDL